MRLQPIVYTTAMEASVEWYRTVLGVDPSYASDVWTSFPVDGGALALHRTESLPDSTRVALSLVATDALERVLERLESAEIAPEQGIQEETFGRSVLLRDPNGNAVQVNEH